MAFFREYDAALNAKDINKLASLYHPDAKFLKGPASIVVGPTIATTILGPS